jgi:outer membrane protein insertion porin family
MKIILLIFLIILFSNITFAATEVTEISFKQSSGFDNDELLDLIHSQEDDEFEPRLIKLDKILLNNFFRKNGYLLVDVSDSLYYFKKRTEVRIKYIIDTGPRYYYGGVRFEGEKELTEEQLSKPFKDIEIGSPFDESLVIEARKRVENIYYNSGKPFVSVKSDFRFEQDSLVFAFIQIKENQTIYIKKIKYFSLNIVKKFLIRRELEVHKGDMYNREAMEKSQQNIYGTGLFRFVRLEIDPIPDNPENVILKIIVQERDARWIGVNFGVGHEEFYGSTAEVTLQGGHRNLFGTARSASLHITPSFLYEFDQNKIINAENKIAFKYVEPWIGYTRTPGIFQVSYHQYRLPNSGNFNLLQSSFEVHHKFFNSIEISGTIGAKYLTELDSDSIDTKNLIGISAGQAEIYSVSSYAKRDTRENLFNPAKGSLTDFSISFSQSVSSSDSLLNQNNRYFTLTTSWSRFQPWRIKIGRNKFKWTLASRLKAGAIFEIGKTKSIPISERFYAGGATTVRGYSEQLLGPVASLDKSGKINVAAGGKLLLLGNIEARIPLFWLLMGEVFFDAGNVWAGLNDFDAQEIRYTSGVGIAILTPLGPVRVDYGYKLNKRSVDADNDAFHLGIYFAF